MEFFKSLASILAYAALGFSITAAYLKINKIWKRKHHAEVANSVSIAGNFIAVVPWTFFGINFLFVAQWQGLINSIIWVVTFIVLMLIGSGLWVEGKRNMSFWARLKDSLKLERSEVGDLALSLFRPSSAQIILELLAHFAYIDRHLADQEKNFIQSFGDRYKLEIDWNEFEKLADIERSERFMKTRDMAEEYLKTSPPAEQVAQLSDLLETLVKIDDDYSIQEKLIQEEVRGLLLDYCEENHAKANCSVVIVPQSREQDAAISAILPQTEKTELAGGSGYMVGSFYSKSYAEVICNQYRALGFFTIDIIQDAVDPARLDSHRVSPPV